MTISKSEWEKFNETSTRPYTESKFLPLHHHSDPLPLRDVMAPRNTSTERTRRARAAAKEKT